MSTFAKGKWNVICDQCGLRYKSNQLRLQWNNLRTCSGPGTQNCWEPRNVQEKVRGKYDRQAPPWVRPEGEDVTLSVNEITADDL